MKQYEFKAFGRKHAKVKAYHKYGAIVIHDATKIIRRKKYTGQEILMYVADLMERRKWFAKENIAVLFEVKPGHISRKSHAKYEYVQQSEKRIIKRKIEVRSVKTNELYGTVNTRKEARELGKQLVFRHGEDFYGTTVYDSPLVDFYIRFKPDPKFIEGEYIIFVADVHDVKMYKQHNGRF